MCRHWVIKVFIVYLFESGGGADNKGPQAHSNAPSWGGQDAMNLSSEMTNGHRKLSKCGIARPGGKSRVLSPETTDDMGEEEEEGLAVEETAWA